MGVLLVLVGLSAAPFIQQVNACEDKCAMLEPQSCCLPQGLSDCEMSSTVLFVPILSAPLNKTQEDVSVATQPVICEQSTLIVFSINPFRLVPGLGHAPPSSFLAPLRI